MSVAGQQLQQMQSSVVTVSLPSDLWRLVLAYVPFDDRLALLRLLSVCKAMFGHLERQCWQFLYHLSQTLPLRRPYTLVTHDGRGLNMRVALVSQDAKNGRLYLPCLIRNIASDARYFTRETLSFLLAAVLHEPMRNHTVDYNRYKGIDAQRPLRELYRFQPADQCLVPLHHDPDVKVYTLPDGVHLPPPTEVERIALAHYTDCDRRYAVFYAIARDKLVLRDPLPGDPLYRVVLRGEHIFSEAREIELGALFCYRAKQGAEWVRMMDIVKLNVEWAQMHARNCVRDQFRSETSDDQHQVHHDVYRDNGELFGSLFGGGGDDDGGGVMEVERVERKRRPPVQQIVLDDDESEENGASGEEEEEEDDDTTLDSDMFSDETTDQFTDDTVSCDVPSASAPDGDDDEPSVSVTLDSDDDDPRDADDADDDEDDNYALDSDTDDDIGSTSASSSSSDEEELSAELAPLRKIIDCT